VEVSKCEGEVVYLVLYKKLVNELGATLDRQRLPCILLLQGLEEP
jgi:hypothetical protein